MFCKNCGSQIDDRAIFCPHCGVATDNAPNVQQQYAPPMPKANKGLVTAAKVFIILGIVIGGAYMLTTAISLLTEIATAAEYNSFIIAYIAELAILLIWYIPGVVFGAKALKQIPIGKPSTAVTICVLIFNNVIGGILLLCTKEEDYK